MVRVASGGEPIVRANVPVGGWPTAALAADDPVPSRADSGKAAAETINRSLWNKRNAGIGIILGSFVGLVIASVIDQSAGAEFAIVLAVFSIVVIALAPWVLGK